MSSDFDPVQEYDFIFKIVLVGDSGVGKTSLVQRYIDQSFRENQASTIGIDFAIRTLKIENRLVKLQIWDTAGQEQYKVVSKQFYRGSNAFIFVYDVTRPSTLMSITNWMTEVETVCSPIPIMYLVGNKQDLPNYGYDNGEAFAYQNGMHFIQTSAKSGFQVEEMITDVADKLVTFYDARIIESVNRSNSTIEPKLEKKQRRKIIKKDDKCCILM